MFPERKRGNGGRNSTWAATTDDTLSAQGAGPFPLIELCRGLALGTGLGAEPLHFGANKLPQVL